MWELILLENSFSFFLRPAHVKQSIEKSIPTINKTVFIDCFHETDGEFIFQQF